MSWSHIKHDLKRAINRAGITDPVVAAEVVVIAETALQKDCDKDFTLYIKPYMFKRGVLYVKASSSIVMQEVLLVEQDLLKAINKRLKAEIVRNIRFS